MTHLLLAVIYLSFVSLGLPDSVLGAAWPSMYGAFGVPMSYAGAISMIICVGTIISSLETERLTEKLGTGKVTALSVAMTAAALFGFSVSNSFWALCLWAIPYGLGAGSVDASLNNYVALHYASRHMSWLHCMWGVGASLGPYVMGYALTRGQGWNMGYRYIAIMQIVLTAVLLLSLPLWKKKSGDGDTPGAGKALKLREIVKIPGVKAVMATFFCYCALEQTAGLWAASYLTLHKGLSAERAASFASMFFIGITVGRAISGFLTIKLKDTQMVRLGQGIVVLGILVLFLPLGPVWTLVGLVLTGLGCAPIYPSLIHAAPTHFGASRSQAIISVQMASAYVGTCFMPPLFGLVAQHLSVTLFPVYLLLLLGVMFISHEVLLKRAPGERGLAE